jgi:hypothetical protein
LSLSIITILVFSLFSSAPVGAQEPSPDSAKEAEGQPDLPPEVEVIPYLGPTNAPAARSAIGISALTSGVDLGEIEVESNNATAISGSNVKIKGNVFPNGDIDFYAFTAPAGQPLPIT